MTDLTGETRALVPGGRVVFNMIPPGSEQPVPMRYQEVFTGETRTAPDGTQVRLNTMGDVGKPPMMSFMFTQDDDGSIFLHGVELPDGTAHWVSGPEDGRVLNYPGHYELGVSWTQDYQMGDEPPTQLTHTVEDVEDVTIPLGTYRSFRIVSRTEDGSLDGVSWFAPDLGVNIKKFSYSQRPGYELAEIDFAE